MNFPKLDKTAELHSEQLKKIIHADIVSQAGFISFARFMELALYTPGYGYYSAGQQKLGAGGDFVTAPEISPLFAKCIARQCQQILTSLAEPTILELGAGSGVFVSQLLMELEKLGCLPKTYFILEVSADLRERQKTMLLRTCPHLISCVQWLNTLPPKITGIIFANEVMDALPVHCFEVEKNEIKERGVVWRDNAFAWQLAAPATALYRQVERLRQHYSLAENYQSEINLMLPAWVQAIASVLAEGVILLFDYGYGEREYYHPQRNRGTLLCYYQHHYHENPFRWVGLQDITAHVNFTAVIESVATDCRLAGYTTQMAFLMATGIAELAEKENHSSSVDLYRQAQAIKTLTLPSQMGEKVKVMALSKKCNLPLLGFSFQDRRCDL